MNEISTAYLDHGQRGVPEHLEAVEHLVTSRWSAQEPGEPVNWAGRVPLGNIRGDISSPSALPPRRRVCPAHTRVRHTPGRNCPTRAPTARERVSVLVSGRRAAAIVGAATQTHQSDDDGDVVQIQSPHRQVSRIQSETDDEG